LKSVIRIHRRTDGPPGDDESAGTRRLDAPDVGLNLSASAFPGVCPGVSERIQMSFSIQIEDSPPLAAGSFNLPEKSEDLRSASTGHLDSPAIALCQIQKQLISFIIFFTLRYDDSGERIYWRRTGAAGDIDSQSPAGVFAGCRCTVHQMISCPIRPAGMDRAFFHDPPGVKTPEGNKRDTDFEGTMKILVLNCGSSSVKFQVFDMKDQSQLVKGLVEKIGSSDAIINYQARDKNKIREIKEVLNHEVAVELMLTMLLHPQYGVIRGRGEIKSVGHRVVHGGEAFSKSVLITEKVKAAITRCIQFAPLHNPHNLKGIEACERLLPGAPQVAVFDTAFHHTIPQHAYMYGLPYALYEKLGIRKYGFHGTSHLFVAQRAADVIGRPIERLKLITCHLGNGASITAVDGGKSVDTSMGFTPLEGLVMGTRCGDIDPALVPYIMQRENLSASQIDSILNKNSGMLGLTGTSNDMREITSEAKRGSARHQLALDIYCYRVRKYIGAYMAALGHTDAIVFTGGVGENSVFVRARSLEGLESLGISVDPAKNEAHETRIGPGPVEVLVIPTNEELAIARDTYQIIRSGKLPLEEQPEAEQAPGPAPLSEADKMLLVQLWAENSRIGAAQLAERLGKKLGKPVGSDEVRRNLERLGLSGLEVMKKSKNS